jgi:hypothetical protein
MIDNNCPFASLIWYRNGIILLLFCFSKRTISQYGIRAITVLIWSYMWLKYKDIITLPYRRQAQWLIPVIPGMGDRD